MAQPASLIQLFQNDPRVAPANEIAKPQLSMSWPSFDAVLPDGGLPIGVVELTAPRALGGGTMAALAAVRSAHKRDPQAWCAWIDPEGTLFAPGVAMAEVDLERLLVVRPSRESLSRIAVKVARSHAFSVIVIDADALATDPPLRAEKASASHQRDVFVRRLSLVASETGATILMLTNSQIPHASPLPVALRLEMRRERNAIEVKVGKERRGRIGLSQSVSLRSRPTLELVG